MSTWLVPWESGPLPALRSREAGSLGPTQPPSSSGGPSQKHDVAQSPLLLSEPAVELFRLGKQQGFRKPN